MPFQWNPADQCPAASAVHRVYLWSPREWFGSLDLLLPHQAVEEQHGVTLQPVNSGFSAQRGLAFPRHLLHVQHRLDVWGRSVQHLPLHVGIEPQCKYHLLDGYRPGQVHARGASPSSHQLPECLQSHVWSPCRMGAHHLNDGSCLQSGTQQHNPLRELLG